MARMFRVIMSPPLGDEFPGNDKMTTVTVGPGLGFDSAKERLIQVELESSLNQVNELDVILARDGTHILGGSAHIYRSRNFSGQARDVRESAEIQDPVAPRLWLRQAEEDRLV